MAEGELLPGIPGVTLPGEPLPAPPIVIRPPTITPPVEPDGAESGQLPFSGPVGPIAPPVPGETEPESPRGLPGLGDISRLLVILGLILLAAIFIDALNKLLRFVLGPFSRGRKPKKATPEQWTQWVSNALGSAYQQLDGDLGLSFEQLAQTGTKVGQAIVNAEIAIYRSATRIAGHTATLAGLHAAGATARAHADAAAALAATTLTETRASAARASAREDALQAQLQALTEHVHHVLEPELEALRHAIPELQRGAHTAWEELQQHGELLGAAAGTAAVAAALSSLGGSWIRCESNKLLGEAMCEQGPQSANNLVQLLLKLGVLLNLREYVKLEQELVRPITEATAALLGARF